ncbi:protein artemis [Diachasma alloeum]|uniref:protein artemis n=1 Tax=Diachasma alloeum TaxID=454923 RepID=UPI00073814F7|nr:protein artemis [Diachasma alloeum]
MSTFRGIIEELPGISVDRFEEANRSSSTVFFLSHFHCDHRVGLDQSFFQQLTEKNQYLYCSPLTKNFIVTKWNLGSMPDRIREITACNPIVVSYRDPNVGDSDGNCDLVVTVTAVPAGHCPGSIMLLFEANRDNKYVTVLCTGDFRIHPEDFAKLKPLHVKVNGKLVPKALDNIYLDTTFYDERLEHLPSRQEALGHIVPVVQDWLRQSDKNFIVIETSADYGSEDLFSKLSAAVKQRIHVRNWVQESYRYIPESSVYSTENTHDTRVHACMMKQQARFRTNNSNPLICRSEVKAENILTIVPSVLRWIGKDLSKGVTEWEDRRFYVCYSCHASYSELREFIDYFKPRKIHPCVVPGVKDAWCPESQEKFREFQAKINYAHLRAPEGRAKSLDCDFMEYKSFKRLRPKTDKSSDDDF